MEAGPCKSVLWFAIRPGFSLALFDRSSLQQSSSQPENRKLHRCTLMIGDGLKGPSWLELGHFIITSICSLHGPAHIALWSEPWKGCCKETSQVSPLFLKRASKAKKNMSEVSVELTCPPVQWVGELDEAWCGCTHRYLLWILAAWNFLCHQSHLVGLEAHWFLGKFGRWKSLHPVFGSLSLEEVGSLYLSPLRWVFGLSCWYCIDIRVGKAWCSGLPTLFPCHVPTNFSITASSLNTFSCVSLS